MKRNRILYAVLAAACIGLGLASRAFRADLPAFLGEYGGDTIWAMMVYFLFARLIGAKTRVARIPVRSGLFLWD